MGVHSPLLNMLPLRIPTWVPQDSVYLVTNPSVTHSRMPRPRYNNRYIIFKIYYTFKYNYYIFKIKKRVEFIKSKRVIIIKVSL